MKEHIISFPSEISNLTNLEINLQAVGVRLSEIVDKLAEELDMGGRSLIIAVMTRSSDRIGQLNALFAGESGIAYLSQSPFLVINKLDGDFEK